MRVGGARVVDRAIRMLGRLRDAHVVVADDGSVSLPRRLPANMELRRFDPGDADAKVAALMEELGPESSSVGADTVWVTPSRPDRSTRVVDRRSRRAAEKVIFDDVSKETFGLADRLINRRIWSPLTRMLLVHLPLTSTMLTLLAGFVGLFGAVTIAGGGNSNVVTGFAILQGSLIIEGCAGTLARLRMHQSALGAWLEMLIGDFVTVVMMLAVGVALWRTSGNYLDMKLGLAAAGMTLVSIVMIYRELILQREGAFLNLRWWFTYCQTLKHVSGSGSRSTRLMVQLGRRDVLILLGLVLAACDQLPALLLYFLIVSIARVGGTLGQLLTPAWRIRPQA